MRLIVTTMPKSGTYLVVELFERLGLEFTGMHLAAKHYTDYSEADYDTARFRPQTLNVDAPLTETVQRIGEGQFSVGHLSPGALPEELRRGLRIVFVRREVRAALFSYFRFLRETGRQNATEAAWYHMADKAGALRAFLADQGERRIEMYRTIGGWAALPEIPTLKFEWLVRRDVASIAEQLSATDPHFSRISAARLDAALSEALTVKTMTRSERSEQLSFDECWNDEAERFFREHGGPEVDALLGYTE